MHNVYFNDLLMEAFCAENFAIENFFYILAFFQIILSKIKYAAQGTQTPYFNSKFS